jgi:transmembrane protein TMEM174 (potassium channel)
LAYLVSFSTIGAVWFGHTVITEYLDHADSVLIRLNLLLAMSMVSVMWRYAVHLRLVRPDLGDQDVKTLTKPPDNHGAASPSARRLRSEMAVRGRRMKKAAGRRLALTCGFCLWAGARTADLPLLRGRVCPGQRHRPGSRALSVPCRREPPSFRRTAMLATSAGEDIPQRHHHAAPESSVRPAASDVFVQQLTP